MTVSDNEFHNLKGQVHRLMSQTSRSQGLQETGQLVLGSQIKPEMVTGFTLGSPVIYQPGDTINFYIYIPDWVRRIIQFRLRVVFGLSITGVSGMLFDTTDITFPVGGAWVAPYTVDLTSFLKDNNSNPLYGDHLVEILTLVGSDILAIIPDWTFIAKPNV